METIVHIVISGKYVEGYAYQENLLPAKQVQLGYKVFLIASQLTLNEKHEPCFVDPKRYCNKEGVNVVILPCTRNKNLSLFWFFDKCRGLYEELCKINPDILFVHEIGAVDQKYIIKYKIEHPSVTVFADNHLDYYNASPVSKTLTTSIKHKIITKLRARRAKALSRYTQTFWGTLPWRVDYLVNVFKIKKEKTDLLIMGADETYIEEKDRESIRYQIRETYDIPEDAFLIITGGKIDSRKQQYLLAEAVKGLVDKNIWLLIFGTPTKEMEPVFKNYTNIRNIKMIGWVLPEKVYDLFFASDLAVYPGTHSVLWEQSLACGTPCVFKRWPGMEHINVNGNAVLLDNVSVDILKRTILNIANTDLYYEIKKKTEAIASRFFLKEIAQKSIGK